MLVQDCSVHTASSCPMLHVCYAPPLLQTETTFHVVCTQGDGGDTAILLACSSAAPDLDLIAALINTGAPLSVQDKATGNTPLLSALKLGGMMGLNLAKLLLEAAGTTADGCNMTAVNTAGESALTLAASAALTKANSNTAEASEDKTAAFDMLSLLLERKPEVPEQLATALLVKGLAGNLPDHITSQVGNTLSAL